MKKLLLLCSVCICTILAGCDFPKYEVVYKKCDGITTGTVICFGGPYIDNYKNAVPKLDCGGGILNVCEILSSKRIN